MLQHLQYQKSVNTNYECTLRKDLKHESLKNFVKLYLTFSRTFSNIPDVQLLHHLKC